MSTRLADVVSILMLMVVSCSQQVENYRRRRRHNRGCIYVHVTSSPHADMGHAHAQPRMHPSTSHPKGSSAIAAKGCEGRLWVTRRLGVVHVRKYTILMLMHSILNTSQLPPGSWECTLHRAAPCCWLAAPETASLHSRVERRGPRERSGMHANGPATTAQSYLPRENAPTAHGVPPSLPHLPHGRELLPGLVGDEVEVAPEARHQLAKRLLLGLDAHPRHYLCPRHLLPDVEGVASVKSTRPIMPV